MNLTKEQRKKLTELYPFLIPRNVFTDEIPENYDYDYIRGEGEIPFGWRRLFFMYCKKIRPILSEYNLLDNYRFNQLKEKYGTLRIYDNAAPAKIHILNSLYSCFANYICQRCGQFANFETSGWVESICENCYTKENINNYDSAYSNPLFACCCGAYGRSTLCAYCNLYYRQWRDFYTRGLFPLLGQCLAVNVVDGHPYDSVRSVTTCHHLPI